MSEAGDETDAGVTPTCVEGLQHGVISVRAEALIHVDLIQG